ncbi:glycosyltransferase family 2 protein [Cereibacter changlensis]|uniref:glycosyltransferase family 2 protein n=1 Tax=Cereibacter changlensis TaxID=402884 RepID=UPI001B803C34|nr:glycosyltransferase family 2 protein [Cereibacter changlensis]
MTSPTIVTLSSIPPRFGLIAPTLRSLLAQKVPVQAIHLYIPRTYRRFPDWDGSLPEVPEGISIRRCDEDLGPATKVLPATRDYEGQDVDILFCDDDKIYDPGWHGRLKRARAAHPQCCIVEAGETLPDIADVMRPKDRLPRAKRFHRKTILYRIKRLASLFRMKAPAFSTSGYVDLLGGHGGVMVRPDWFGQEAWKIPDVLWTVDDPWLSGHLERRGIPIWLEAKARRTEATSAQSVDALYDLVEMDHDRVRADIAAIDYMRSTYGIWTPGGAVRSMSGCRNETLLALARRASGNADS